MNKQKLNWADMNSDDDNDDIFFDTITNVNIDEIPTTKKIKSVTNDVNSLYIKQENERKKNKTLKNFQISTQSSTKSSTQSSTQSNTQSSTQENEWKVVSKKKRNSKCYTCFPRKKVLEHIIEKNEYVSFHHDLCNRNIIVVTPNNHFSSFDSINPTLISNLFLCTHKFCLDWNIKDYSVTYSQGEWQSHDHFHLKIKTHENIIKRLRGDHWRRQKLLKERNAV